MSAAEQSDEIQLGELYRGHFGAAPERVVALRAHGSDRRIYRLNGPGGTVVGVLNAVAPENRAFIAFSRHFRACGLPVPEIFCAARDELAYLEEDLGDTSLFEVLGAGRSGGGNEVSAEAAAVYEQVVKALPEFQVRGGRDFDESQCFPRPSFDRQSMAWDLNYFKYYFLKLARVPFHEQELESDFETLTDYLLKAPSDYFLYRDFQSRNVMVRDGAPWFIDYQGGRRGALQYDLASLLVDAKANLPFEFRDRLVDLYLDALSKQIEVDRGKFLGFYEGFTLIRIMQAMGAYGFRGFYERKTQFLQSVPYAIRNLEVLLASTRWPVKLPALFEVLHSIVRSTRLREVAPVPLTLSVRVESFSFKKGYPADESGHGGGFVFDCRSLPNPGREEAHRLLAGDGPEVESWLAAHSEVGEFFTRARDMVDQVVDVYAKRNFTHLGVSFGCTGGQHRSVYMATQLARHLREHKQVKVELVHRDVQRPEAAGQS